MTVLQFALLGLGAGAIYALLGQGLVLIYRGSGLLNFAQGGVAMIAAQVFYGLRDSHGVPTAIAAAVSLALAAAIGVAMQLVVLRRLRNASTLARLMSTLALLGLTQGIGTVAWNANGYGTSSLVTGILPTSLVRFSSQLSIPADRLILLGLAVALTCGFWVVYHRTRFGLATSAVAENPRAAVALGWSAEAVSAANWAVGCLLAGMAGILLSPIAGLSVTALVLTVIPGLAAALVGQFASFWLVLAGGLGLGVVQSEMERYVHSAGWADAVPFLVVSAFIVLRGRALPLRADPLDRPTRAGTGVLRPRPTLVATAAILAVVYFLPGKWALAVSSSALMGLVALSMIIITGYCGQISLAQVPIAGIGALTAANLSFHFGVPFPVCILAGTFCAGAVGLIIGMPALRARGVNLAVITIGLGIVIQEVVFGDQALIGGATGVLIPNSPTLFGLQVDSFYHPVRYTAMVCAVFILAAMAVANLRRGRTGRRLLALRSNERAAAAAGVDVYATKLYAFGVASAIAGLSGALAAYQLSALNIGSYDTIGSITALLSTVIGGLGYIGGAIVAGLASSSGGVTQEALSYLNGTWANYVGLYGTAIALFVLMSAPDGLVPYNARQLRSLVHRVHPRHAGRKLTVRGEVAEPPGRQRITNGTESTGRKHRETGELLSVRGLTVTFGGVRALSDVDLDAAPGRVVGLIGPNGAGKTTLIDAVTGIVPYAGTIRLGADRMERLTVRARSLRGLGRTFQGAELFEDMTVLENIRVASEARGAWSYLTDLVHPGGTGLPPVAAEAVAILGLESELDMKSDELPAGRRRLVGIARMLAADPGAVLLDEPAAGLNDDEKAELAELIGRLAREWGLAVLLIEHDVSFVEQVSDEIVALALGEVIARGEPARVLSDEAVRAAYLGDAEPEEKDAVAGEMVP